MKPIPKQMEIKLTSKQKKISNPLHLELKGKNWFGKVSALVSSSKSNGSVKLDDSSSGENVEKQIKHVKN